MFLIYFYYIVVPRVLNGTFLNIQAEFEVQIISEYMALHRHFLLQLLIHHPSDFPVESSPMVLLEQNAESFIEVHGSVQMCDALVCI